MNCKKCGRVLRAGDTFCPYCGTAVSASGGSADSGFNWNLADDSPKPGPTVKKTEISFDWNTEKADRTDAGRPVAAQESRWTEPEEARQLFTFDQEHAELQKQVDQKVDKMAAERPTPAVQRERREDLFVLPSEMTMDDFSDLLGESLVRENSRVLVVSQKNAEQQESSSKIYEADPLGDSIPVTPSVFVQEDMPEQEIRTAADPEQESPAIPDFSVEEIPRIPPRRKQQKIPKQRSAEDQAYDPFAGKDFLVFTEVPVFLATRQAEKESVPAAADGSGFTEQPVSAFDMGKLQHLIGGSPSEPVKEQRSLSLSSLDPGYTPEEERKAIENFQSLIRAEESFSESVNQFVFLSGEEGERAEQASRRREELSVGPKASFISIEDEYQKYREDHEPLPISLIEGRKTGSDAADTGKPDGERPEDNHSKQEESSDTSDITETENTVPKPASEKKGKVARIIRQSSRRTMSEEEETDENPPEKEQEIQEDAADNNAAEASETVSSVTASSIEGKKKSRELNIKINEPSGTQFTVRTEEVNLLDNASRLKDTQEVDLGKLKEGPKSVRVQVEVNHTASSSSVEVTRADDGSTVVKTVEEGEENERRYDAEGVDLFYRRPEEESFWEKNELPSDRMTLTEIFSPDLQDFRKRWEEEEQQKKPEGNGEESDSEEDWIDQFLSSELKKEGNLIELEEESVPGSEAENAAAAEIIEPVGDASHEEAGETEKPVSSDESLETEEPPAASEESSEITESQERFDIQDEEAGQAEEEAGEAESMEESAELQPEETQDQDTENTDDSDDIEQAETPEKETFEEEEPESEEEKGSILPEEKEKEKTEETQEIEATEAAENPEGPQKSASGEESPEETETETEAKAEAEDTEEIQGLFGSLYQIRHRIAEAMGAGEEEEEEDAFEEELPEEDDEEETEGRWSSASVMSVIIVLLVIAIVIEFAVIGVKLFAPNSQGAVLIKRIEQTISGEKPNFVIEAEAQLSDGSIVEFPED